MTATQKHLPIRVELNQPVMDLAAARSILRCHEDDIKRWVYEDLSIPAWNIARVHDIREGGKDDRRFRHELRLFAPAVRDLFNSRLAETYDDDFITLRLYGRPRLLLQSTFLARCWYCDAQHIGNLIRDRTLLAVQPLAQGVVADVTWASALKFLQSRRIK